MHDFKQHRLQNLLIASPQLINPVAVLSHLGAIQGQDYTGAKWSLGMRTVNSTDAQIEQAIADQHIVRTWLMRGTLFMTTAHDVRWLLGLVAPRIIAQTKGRYKELELDAKTLAHSNDVLIKALEDGKQLGRRHLYRILEEQGISTKGQRGVHIVRHTSLEGFIVQGTMHKNDPVFMRLDTIAPTQPMPKEVALAEFTRRYFSSHGWATLQDFAWWSGLLMSEVRAGLEAIRSELIAEDFAGDTYYRPANDRPITSPQQPTIYTPSGFDEYLLGYKNRDLVLEPEHALKVYPGKNGVFFPTIIIDGQIRGIWKRSFKKQVVQITVSPFNALTQAETDAFTSAIQRYSAFLEMPITVKF